MKPITEPLPELPYRDMYATLQRGHGKQITLCKQYLQEGAELYCKILKKEREGDLQGYSPERECITQLMTALSALYSCMIETDIAVENVVLQ